MEVTLSLTVLISLMLLTEFLAKHKLLQGESARKFAHTTTGLYGATWPFFMTWRQIQIIWVVCMILLVVSRRVLIIKSVYQVERSSYGDILGPFTLGALTLFEPNPVVFSAAVLHVALADGFAALLGVKYGKKNRYRVFGSTKSVVGTATFLTVSLLINFSFWASGLHGFGEVGINAILLASGGATLLENVAGLGFDNVAVPVYVAVVLSVAL